MILALVVGSKFKYAYKLWKVSKTQSKIKVIKHS